MKPYAQIFTESKNINLHEALEINVASAFQAAEAAASQDVDALGEAHASQVPRVEGKAVVASHHPFPAPRP